MNHSDNLVSVVIPAYNSAWCVRRAIDSVLGQGGCLLEIVVVDDGSSDETPEVLASYGDSIRVVRQVNSGLSSARNAGIRESQGPYIAFLDADDWWLPGKLDAQIDLMLARPEVGFCSVATRVEDGEGNLLNIWGCPDYKGSFLEYLFHNLAAVAGSGSGVVVRKALFEQTGLFDESLDSLEDIDMWMRLAAVSEYVCIPEQLAAILKHPESMSRNREVMRNASIQVMNKNRHLLAPARQRGYWRAGMANVFADYAKWQYREGLKSEAIGDLMWAFLMAPLRRGRLCLGLLKDILLGRSI